MKIAMRLTALLAVFLAVVDGLSLSYRMKQSEPRTCFYIPVHDTSALIQTYYSATNSKSYDDTKGVVSMVVQGPKGQQLHSIPSQSHSEISIKPIEVGEHSICFTHGSVPSDKNLDIDVSLTNADGSPFVYSRPDDAGKVLTQASADAATQALETTASKLNKDLSEINHTLKYLKNREKRNSETVDSIDKVIFYFSFFETLLIFGMSLCQVAILRHFFGRSGRPRV